MKTHALGLVLLLVVLVVSVPREDNMVLADLVAKMASGDALSPAEIQAVRLGVARVQSLTDRMSAIVGEGGPGLHSDVFRNSGMFSLLPHESAALHQTPADAQVIPDQVWTNVTASAASGATWSEGLGLDLANSRIVVTGIPHETIVDIVAWAVFADNTTGVRGIRWLADDGSSLTRMQAVPTGQGASVGLSHKRKVSTTHTYYYIQVWQNSGGDLALDGAYFALSRVR